MKEDFEKWLKGELAYNEDGKAMKFVKWVTRYDLVYVCEGREKRTLKIRVIDAFNKGKLTLSPPQKPVYDVVEELKKWKSGVLAISNGNSWAFVKQVEEIVTAKYCDCGVYSFHIETIHSYFRRGVWKLAELLTDASVTLDKNKVSSSVLTPQEVAEGWVKWEQGMEIPDFKAGQWQRLYRDSSQDDLRGCAQDTKDAICWSNPNFIAYRIIKSEPQADADGWIPVVDGKCPEIAKDWKAREWERKFCDGSTTVSCYDAYHKDILWNGYNNNHKTVAVRKIKKSEPISEITYQNMFDDYEGEPVLGTERMMKRVASLQAQRRSRVAHLLFRENTKPVCALGEERLMDAMREACKGHRVQICPPGAPVDGSQCAVIDAGIRQRGTK